MDKREIKFKFKWTDGKEWIVKDFTLDEIMNGEPFDYLSDSPFFRNYKMVERVQYTGLKDANGVEIYEGDILVCEYGHIWVVSYNDRGFWMAHNPDDIHDFVFLDDYDFQVGGNIHEKAELLK